MSQLWSPKQKEKKPEKNGAEEFPRSRCPGGQVTEVRSQQKWLQRWQMRALFTTPADTSPTRDKKYTYAPGNLSKVDLQVRTARQFTHKKKVKKTKPRIANKNKAVTRNEWMMDVPSYRAAHEQRRDKLQERAPRATTQGEGGASMYTVPRT